MMGPEILGELVDRHSRALVLYARQWCAAPEDVVQEAFLKMVTYRPAPNKVVPWLFRVVRNAAISASRAEKRRRRHEAAAAEYFLPWFDAGEDTVLDGRTVAQALQALPAEPREAITLHLWGGLTFEEVAEVTGCSSSTAHRWYLAGLDLLRERLRIHVRSEF
jgi:RNA polymerase sigma factor (sigma-70 family)